MSDSSEAKLAQFRLEYVANAEDAFDHYMSISCESPIERLFLAAMLTGGWRFPEMSEAHELFAFFGNEHHTAGWFIDDAGMWCVPQQKLVLKGRAYRIDFAFYGPRWSAHPAKIAVELDGHDFHERTKEQATTDKRRDRLMQASGWRVLRFTGSEVWKDAVECLTQVIDLAFEFGK